jgi:hypothetical protein
MTAQQISNLSYLHNVLLFRDLVFIFVPIVLILFFISFNKKYNQAKNCLKIADQKILEFKNKSFSSPEDKEKAKQTLKEELVVIKNQVFIGNSLTRHTPAMFLRTRDEIDDKIMLL